MHKLIAALAAVALLASGCGDSEDPASTGPVTIRHALGTTTIPATPKRIVTVGYSDHEILLALGIKPVGAMDWFGEGTWGKWPWEQKAWGGKLAQVVSAKSFEIDFEKVAALHPDLILGLYAELKRGDYDKLSKIAPTVAQAKGTAYTTPWRDMTRTAARAVGRVDDGEKLIDKVDGQLAAFREAHPELAKQTATIVDAGQAPKSFYAFSDKDPRGQFLGELGFKPAARLNTRIGKSFGTEISQERIDLLDVGRLFMLIDPPARKRLDKDALFNRLPVAREDRVTDLPYYSSTKLGAALAFNSVLSIPYALRGFEREFGRGDTPAAPKRVVALDFPSTDAVLALGVEPVAISKVSYVTGGMQSWTKAALGGARPRLLDTENAIPLEQIAALKPDLIVATSSFALPPVLAKVKKIAPVVTWKRGPGADPWQESTLLIGRALGREAQARKLVADTAERVARARSEHPAFAGKTVTLFNYWKGNAYAISDPDDASIRFFDSLGMKLPAAIAGKGKDRRLEVSTERLGALDADVVLGTSATEPDQLRSLVRGKLFGELSAVKRDAYATVPIGPATSIAFPSVLSVNYALDELVPVLARLAS